MTELGAPADLGDVDVLAWNSDGAIQLIECKRLTFARTIAEIANICKRFQGRLRTNWPSIRDESSGLDAIPNICGILLDLCPIPLILTTG